MGRLLTPAEVAARLRVDRETVYRHIRAGTIRAARIGRAYRVDEAVLDEFVVASKGGLHSPLARERIGVHAEPSPPVFDHLAAGSGQLSAEQRTRAVQLVAQWRANANDREHQESWEFLRNALDEDRLSSRRLFS